MKRSRSSTNDPSNQEENPSSNKKMKQSVDTTEPKSQWEKTKSYLKVNHGESSVYEANDEEMESKTKLENKNQCKELIERVQQAHSLKELPPFHPEYNKVNLHHYQLCCFCGRLVVNRAKETKCSCLGKTKREFQETDYACPSTVMMLFPKANISALNRMLLKKKEDACKIPEMDLEKIWSFVGQEVTCCLLAMRTLAHSKSILNSKCGGVLADLTPMIQDYFLAHKGIVE